MALVLYEPTELITTFHAKQREFQFNGLPNITINQDWQSLGVAAVVWEAALVLGTYFQNMTDDLKGKKVLELGSGTGLAGIVACMLGANVVLTDRTGCLQPLHENTELNLNKQDHFYNVTALEWGSELSLWKEEQFDFIIGADLVYIEESFPALVETFRHFLSLKKGSKVLLSGTKRYEDKYQRFLKLLKDFNMRVVYQNNNSYVLEITL